MRADLLPEPVSLLLVDDDPVALRGLERLLSSKGHRIAASTTNGVEAAELVVELKPQVVITDLEMPGFDGVATTSAIRTLGPDIPVIVYSGNGQQDAAQRCIDAGAVGFVSKMLPLSDLLRAIERAATGKQVGIILDVE